MNKNALIAAMKSSIFDVLETMFFIPVDVVPAENQENEWVDECDMITIRLNFKGPASGFFVLAVPQALAMDVSSDFLGVAPAALTESHVTGTIKEMINMLAGNTLSHYDAAPPFDLDIPTTVLYEETSPSASYDRVLLPIQTPTGHMMLIVACNCLNSGS